MLAAHSVSPTLRVNCATTAREATRPDRSWSGPHTTENGARRMVANLLDHRVVGLNTEDVVTDRSS